MKRLAATTILVLGLAACGGQTAETTTTGVSGAEPSDGTEATTTEATATTATMNGAQETYIVEGFDGGPYVFSDVVVSQDSVGDFEVEARVMNDGDTMDAVAWSVTIFSAGSVVGEATGGVDAFPADSSATVTFISADGYVDWDELEFEATVEFWSDRP